MPDTEGVWFVLLKDVAGAKTGDFILSTFPLDSGVTRGLYKDLYKDHHGLLSVHHTDVRLATPEERLRKLIGE
jgi:hypothetical protein